MTGPPSRSMPTCVDCGSTASKPLPLTYPLAQCQVCRLVYAQQWEAEFDEALYDYYADRVDWPIEAFVTAENTASLNRALNRIGRLVPGRRLLDVGCGEGQFVRAAVDTGWDAQGIDLSESAVRICTERLHAPGRVVDFFDQAVGGPFHVVLMSEMIEHVPGPSRFLARARDLLAPGGIVYLTTPNFAALSRHVLRDQWRVICPGHVSYFTPHVLRAKATASGLRVRCLHTENISAVTLRHMIPTPAWRAPTAAPLCSGAPAEDQVLRGALQRRPALRYAASAVNMVLRLTGLGDTIVAILKHER